MVANPSTVWAILSTPNPASGGIPFIAADNATPIIDVLQFYWNDALPGLSIGTTGDNTGTNTINIYGQFDTYNTSSVISTAVALSTQYTNQQVPGFTTSASQGTGTAPAVSLSGDLFGGFSGWGYITQNTVSSFYPLAGAYIYAKGAVVGNIGGEFHIATKADGGLMIDRLYVDNSGYLRPTTFTAGGAVSAGLGAPGVGFSRLTLNYIIALTTGAQAQNTPAGRVIIAAGGTSVAVTNNLVDVNSIIIAVVSSGDATAYVKNVVPGAGIFTINLGAATTANANISYFVINTDN